MNIAPNSELWRIKRAAGSPADYEAIAQEIRARHAVFIHHNACYAVLRNDQDGLCVVCAEGKALGQLAPYIVQIAKKLSAPSIVFHTKRRALARLLSAYHFQYEMTDINGYLVYRMVLNG